MTELSRPSAGLTGAYVDPAVPPAAHDGFEPSPVPLEASNPGGMLRFAAVILGLAGLWQALVGVAALTNPDSFAVSASALPVHNYTAWGWVHLIIGLLALACCFGVLAGNALAAVVAVVLAVVSAAVHLVFLKAEPGAALMVIAMDVLVIWGVTTAQVPRPTD
jgi:hypothetical protein